MKIIIVIAVFFHVLMVVGFLDFIPTWKKNVQWINSFLIVINFILLLYFSFFVIKVFWRRSLVISGLCGGFLVILGFLYSSFFILNQFKDGGFLCCLEEIVEYPIEKPPKTLFLLHYNCIPDGTVVLKIRKGLLPILERVDFTESDRDHSQIIRVSDSHGNVYGYDPIRNNYWYIFK
ncbi:hypothetical protein [Leptospira weilii]|uniref:Uncharacterized protein n=1 Tax=Leptospira weilii str. UI 13098 TaxID=1088542 RepID=M6QIJ4_9LEPT|nr:hypothetical protein [Leptospira weilii]EMN88727.1 hypothetical protein LEP1GSC108_1285 [Leptospira weilii str. UI 13098]